MRKKYDIKLEYLYTLLRMLSPYRSDPDIAKDIAKVQLLIDNLKNKFIGSSRDNDVFLGIKEDLKYYSLYEPYYTYANIFAETGLTLEELSINPSYKKMKISDEGAYSNAQDFIAKQGYFFRRQLREFEKSKYDHIKFIGNNANTDGCVLYLNTTDDAFVISQHNTNFTKIIILVHELEHVVDSYNNPNLYKNYIIREIPSVFMEMTACDDIAIKYGLKDDNFQRRLLLHSIVKEQALVARDKMNMLEVVRRYSYLEYDEIIKILHEEGFSDSNLKYYCGKNLVEDFYYIIAQMTAIELYFIYQRDMELALSILKEIIMDGSDYNIMNILAKYNINLGENITKYEKELVHKLKRGI